MLWHLGNLLARNDYLSQVKPFSKMVNNSLRRVPFICKLTSSYPVTRWNYIICSFLWFACFHLVLYIGGSLMLQYLSAIVWIYHIYLSVYISAFLFIMNDTIVTILILVLACICILISLMYVTRYEISGSFGSSLKLLNVYTQIKVVEQFNILN